jgi:hypothetical protein
LIALLGAAQVLCGLEQLLRLMVFWTPEQARKEVFEFLAGLYNTSRLTSQMDLLEQCWSSPGP